METTGTIIKMLEVKSGTSKAGKEWKTQTFVIDTNEEFNNILALEVFGEEKVNNLTKFNKVGDVVNVSFNVSSREWTNPKTGVSSYFTKADAWIIKKADENGAQNSPEVQPENEFSPDDSDLTF